MKVRKICFVLAVLMLASAFAAGCGQSAAEPAVSPAAAVETTPSPEPTAQAEEEKKELPPPPDIDIDSWEYLYAGVVCGVSRYHPNVRNIESQMLDSRVTSAAQAFLQLSPFAVLPGAGVSVAVYPADALQLPAGANSQPHRAASRGADGRARA